MRAALIAFTMLAGCAGTSPEQQYQIALNSGTNADACSAARRVAEDAMANGQQGRFEMWRPIRDIMCDAAARDPAGPARPAR